MGCENSESLGSFEKQLRAENGFVRVSPEDKFNGAHDDQISGMLHVLSRGIIQNVWSDLWRSVEISGGIVPSILEEESDITESIATLSPEEACLLLSRVTTQVIVQKLYDSISAMEFQCDDLDKLSRYMNYKSALALGGSAINSVHPLPHMMTGFKTGIIESWRIILESCRAYECKNNRRIDRSSLEEIARNSGPLLLKLASTHMSIFVTYVTIVNVGNPMGLDMHEDPLFFHIEGSAPDRKLGISPLLMEKMKGDNYETDDKRYSGCPALYARGICHPNVIEDLYQEMIIPTALHFLQPVLPMDGERRPADA